MSAVRYPDRIQSVHVESIDGELCVYDIASQRMHALNRTAAFVWQRCDGRTAPAELAAALSAEASIEDAEALVRLTLQELAAAQLLAGPIDDVARVSRRDLLRRGVAVAAIPAIYSIVAPSPLDAQSPPPLLGAPTLTSLAPNSGFPGTTVPVALTGTNFVVGATTVTVNSGGVTAANVIVVSTTSLTADIVIDPAPVTGVHTVTVTTAGGTSGAQDFTVNPPPPGAPTLTSVSPNHGIQGATVAVTLTGTNFVVGATMVTVGGGGVTVTNVVVGNTASLTASFVIDPAAALGARTVTVTTAGGTSSAQTFTIGPPPGSQTFLFKGVEETFPVPAGVVAITIEATGAAGGQGEGNPLVGLGGRTTATVSVTPLAMLTVRVGGLGPSSSSSPTAGGFNGGGGSAGDGGGGGGASSVHAGGTPLVIAGGGGGGGSFGIAGFGGDGGDLTADAGGTVPLAGGGGGGGTQAAGGGGGTKGNPSGTDGTAGMAGAGGIGGLAVSGSLVRGGGGGGGGHFGGGGGGGGGAGVTAFGGGGGGGGSSFTAPGATGVVHQQGVNSGAGSVTISW